MYKRVDEANLNSRSGSESQGVMQWRAAQRGALCLYSFLALIEPDRQTLSETPLCFPANKRVCLRAAHTDHNQRRGLDTRLLCATTVPACVKTDAVYFVPLHFFFFPLCRSPSSAAVLDWLGWTAARKIDRTARTSPWSTGRKSRQMDGVVLHIPAMHHCNKPFRSIEHFSCLSPRWMLLPSGWNNEMNS